MTTQSKMPIEHERAPAISKDVTPALKGRTLEKNVIKKKVFQERSSRFLYITNYLFCSQLKTRKMKIMKLMQK